MSNYPTGVTGDMIDSLSAPAGCDRVGDAFYQNSPCSCAEPCRDCGGDGCVGRCGCEDGYLLDDRPCPRAGAPSGEPWCEAGDLVCPTCEGRGVGEYGCRRCGGGEW